MAGEIVCENVNDESWLHKFVRLKLIVEHAVKYYYSLEKNTHLSLVRRRHKEEDFTADSHLSKMVF